MPFLSGVSRRVLWTAAGAVWLGGVVWGFVWVARYENQPGVAAHAAAMWPAESRLTREAGRDTLVMLAHPKCDCTRASLAELAEVMARAHPRPRAYVVFIKPDGTPDAWAQTDLWRSALAIPDVTPVRDDDGVEARRFGGETSGQVLLYDADGLRVFSGGTTGSRGHAGENEGRVAILAWLNGDGPRAEATPVFGCSLFASDAEVRAQEAANHGHHDK